MSQEFSGGELIRKALALMSDGNVRTMAEISEASDALKNSMSRVLRYALRAGLIAVDHKDAAGQHFRITDAGLNRCADIDRASADMARTMVRIPDAPRQWFEV